MKLIDNTQTMVTSLSLPFSPCIPVKASKALFISPFLINTHQSLLSNKPYPSSRPDQKQYQLPQPVPDHYKEEISTVDGITSSGISSNIQRASPGSPHFP